MTMLRLKDDMQKDELAPIQQPASGAMTPMEMLSRALERNADIGVLEKLMDLQERWQAGQARKAFDAAIASAKAEIKPVKKTTRVFYHSKDKDKGPTDYHHETMADIAREVDPVLAKYGLSYRFRTKQAEGNVCVTTILSHRDGHCEETMLMAAPDSSGGKNGIQAIGSAITYLQRYGVKAALGLAAAPDDDGRKADAPRTISEQQVDELIALADDTNADKVKICKWLKVDSIADIAAADFQKAKNALQQRRQQSVE